MTASLSNGKLTLPNVQQIKSFVVPDNGSCVFRTSTTRVVKESLSVAQHFKEQWVWQSHACTEIQKYTDRMARNFTLTRQNCHSPFVRDDGGNDLPTPLASFIRHPHYSRRRCFSAPRTFSIVSFSQSISTNPHIIMASRSGREGMFLKASDRESLLLKFAKFEKKRRQQSQHTESDDEGVVQRDGCRVCKKDNDHTNMLLCEDCSAEYHFYCIGLKAVPTEDWFCGKCMHAPMGIVIRKICAMYMGFPLNSFQRSAPRLFWIGSLYRYLISTPTPCFHQTNADLAATNKITPKRTTTASI